MKTLLPLFLATVATPALAQHAQQPAAAQQAAPPADAGHAPVADPPVGPPPAAAFDGPAHAADTIFGAPVMAPARAALRREHGGSENSQLLIDQLETTVGRGRDGYAWRAEGWVGGDINRFWGKSEGDGQFGGSLGRAEVQGLWSHALDPWWNLQMGVRHDFRTGPDRTYAVLGVQGIAPYWFNISGALFLSDKGDVTARGEAEYDQRLTRKLILQPRVELNVAAQDVPELGIGAGLSTVEGGLRLRYECIPEFAPYIGISHAHAFGNTADFWRARGEKSGEWRFLAGIRAWF